MSSIVQGGGKVIGNGSWLGVAVVGGMLEMFEMLRIHDGRRGHSQTPSVMEVGLRQRQSDRRSALAAERTVIKM